MMLIARAALSFAVMLAMASACADPGAATTPFASASRQWQLPGALSEISGLAVSPDGRLFAHNDERAVIYELDATNGRVISSFTVGAPETGDFEGLAIAPDGTFWLTTSGGALLRFHAGADGARVGSESFDSGLGEVCEIEGLAIAAADLILACKRNRGSNTMLRLFAWRPGEAARPWHEFAASEVPAAAGIDDFQPSSAEIDARSGDIWLLSAKDAAVAQFGENGALRGAWRLGSGHIQAEGLTLLPNGAIVIADEGARGRALLSVFERDHD